MPSVVSVAPARPANLLHALLEVAIAAAVLIVADALVRFLPFGMIAGRIERPVRSRGTPADAAIRRVTWSVGAAQRRLRWIPCLATAIAANRLLAWRGIASKIWLGVRAGEATTFAAHAWLEADGHVVTGGGEKSSFHPLHALVTSHATIS